MIQTPHQALRQAVNDSHNLDELRYLCADLSIDYEHLSGDNKLIKINELLDYCRRNGRIIQLRDYLIHSRAHLPWVDLFAAWMSHDSQADDPLFPLRHLPFHRNTNFTGRESLLDSLAQNLLSNEPIVLTQTIQGMGGVGKTQLALEYAYRNLEAYDLIWWLRAEEITVLNGDIIQLAQRLGLAGPTDTDQAAILDKLHTWLGQTDHRWLLIFDNADLPTPTELRSFLPRLGHGQVLITSRNPQWSGTASVLHVELFTEEEAVEFLRQRTGRENTHTAASLAQVLGRLPLALEHAAAYITQTGLTMAVYHRFFTGRRRDLWQELQPPNAYHATIATTYDLAFQQLQTEAPAAIDLLTLCSFLAPTDIPLRLLSEGADHLPETIANTARDELALTRVIAALHRFALLRREGNTLSLHRLVQAVTRDRLSAKEADAWAETAIDLLFHAWSFDYNDMITWPWATRLLPHAQAAAVRALQTEEAADLNNAIGYYLRQMAQFSAAQPYYERALAIHEQRHGPDHIDTANTLTNLGELLQEMGQHKAAQPYLEQALAIREQVLGPDHPDTAISLNNLGRLQHDLGQYKEARPYYERALTIFEQTLGPVNPNTAESLNDLGVILKQLGQYDAAKSYLERASNIYEQTLGPDHPSTAASLNSLGQLLLDLKQYEEARPHLERALSIVEQVLGSGHPYTAACLNNIGLALEGMGQFETARTRYEAALAIYETALGADHPYTAASLNNLGNLLLEMERYQLARPYLERALAIREKALELDHPLIAQSLNSLGKLLQCMKLYQEARPFYERALAIRKKALGLNHPDTAVILNNLALLHFDEGDYETAVNLMQQTVTIREGKLGPEHPDTVQSKASLETFRKKLSSKH